MAPLAKAEKVGIVIKELRDDAVAAGIDFALEVLIYLPPSFDTDS